ncbi:MULTISPECIES: DUF1643 domain-containing protein [unclassified Rhizobium]
MQAPDLFPDTLARPPIRMQRSAVISDCGLYRYLFTRIWDASKPVLPVCMLNPSRADHEIDDPTVLTLIFFATLWGYGGLSGVNFFAFRASKPAEMMAAVDPFGPENDRYLRLAFNDARHANTPLLAAWGNGGAYRDRNVEFCRQAAHHLVRLVCLGTTQHGHPKHPMARGTHRIPRDQAPMPYAPVNLGAPR